MRTKPEPNRDETRDPAIFLRSHWCGRETSAPARNRLRQNVERVYEAFLFRESASSPTRPTLIDRRAVVVRSNGRDNREPGLPLVQAGRKVDPAAIFPTGLESSSRVPALPRPGHRCLRHSAIVEVGIHERSQPANGWDQAARDKVSASSHSSRLSGLRRANLAPFEPLEITSPPDGDHYELSDDGRVTIFPRQKFCDQR